MAPAQAERVPLEAGGHIRNDKAKQGTGQEPVVSLFWVEPGSQEWVEQLWD